MNGSGRRTEDDLRTGLRDRLDRLAEQIAPFHALAWVVGGTAMLTLTIGGIGLGLIAYRTLPADVQALSSTVAESQSRSLRLIEAQDSAHTARISNLERAALTAEVTRKYLLCLHNEAETAAGCAKILFQLAATEAGDGP